MSSRSCCLLPFFRAASAWPARPACPMQLRREAQVVKSFGGKRFCALRRREWLPRMHAAGPVLVQYFVVSNCFFPRAQLDGAWMQLVFWSTDKIACMPSCAAAFV